MNLKEQRKEFYELLEELTGVKIPIEKISYISKALKDYSNSSNEIFLEQIKQLKNKLERLKEPKKPNVKTFKKKEIGSIRTWNPNEFKSSVNK